MYARGFLSNVHRIYDDREKSKLVRYEVRAVIGPVEHNLLSVHSLTRMGATFEFGPETCSIRVSDIRRMQCSIWANVPWLQAHHRRGRSSSKEDVEMQAQIVEPWSDTSPSNQGSRSPKSRSKITVSQDTSFRFEPNMPRTSNHVKMLQFADSPEVFSYEPNPEEPNHIPSAENDRPMSLHLKAESVDLVDIPLPDPGDMEERHDPETSGSGAAPASYEQLSRKVELELSLHRRRGHLPFDNRCSHCQKSRSAIRHPRVTDRVEHLKVTKFFWSRLISCSLSPTKSWSSVMQGQVWLALEVT